MKRDNSRTRPRPTTHPVEGASPQEIPGAADSRADDSNPKTAPRRARTKSVLLHGARIVFERDGFHNARLSDIVDEARVSIGTFYNYYSSKAEIFRDLMALVTADLMEGSQGDNHWSGDPIPGIEAANRSYVEGYRRNARLMSLLLQVAEQDDEMLALSREIRATFETRISRAIRRWQRQGLAWPDLDPVYAANALAYMVDRFLYEWTLLDLDYDEDRVIQTLNSLWIRGLGLDRLQTIERAAARRRPTAAARTGSQKPGASTRRRGLRTTN